MIDRQFDLKLRKLVTGVSAADRKKTVTLDGVEVPKSATVFFTMLEDEVDSERRYQLFGAIISECGISGRKKAAVKFAEASYREFGDGTSAISLSLALTDDGDLVGGVEQAKEAVELSIKEGQLINDAVGYLMRAAVKTGSVATINEALNILVESTQKPRKLDQPLETDWTDKAEALGANAELIAWVREVAANEQVRHGKKKHE